MKIRTQYILLCAALTSASPAIARNQSPIEFMVAQTSPVRETQERIGNPMRLPSAAIVEDIAQRHGVRVALAKAVMKVESGGNCRARSWAGAVGAMQVLPGTAHAMGVYGPLTDCATGIEAGILYLKFIIDRHGEGCAAMSMYERGEGNRRGCTRYGQMVLANAERF